ncbi:PTS sugar transporter subunit IIA [Streptomyces decoyicus]|uniref:PTS sugar transporter subunit IIA n=1 Tax=Streptomyces decoyicus TaxID=249567 RepID=UPI0004AB972D|nr:PTS sugar transporter subunit IIA [Streptomyces decoyicus]KOG37908.1 PTS sugar transporter [Streptomyces decoyicus]QZY18637.1 PTS sugar transporter subunit IIA [Streptomyces decoyicus]
MAALNDLLPKAAVRLDVRVADWQEAIRAAGGLLVETGATTDGYTAEMIRNVEENGPYLVIAPGFAFAHARPSPAVLRTGMSWVRLEQPVEFGHEANDPVHLVVGLAAEDSGAHTAAMAALAQLLADPATAQALQDATDTEALLAVLAGPDGERDDRGQEETVREQDGDERRAGNGRRAGDGQPVPEKAVHKILTVCGNGVGTSLFLKNTLEQVLDRWGWSRHVTVEATDTISAKGKASEAVAILTSREIARTLGEIGVPVKVVGDFTSGAEVDRILRDTYDV